MTSDYTHTAYIKEPHGAEIFCISFNHIDPIYEEFFASVGSNTSTVYKCLPGGGLQIMHVYEDSDPDEEFYVCKWSVDETTSAPVLLLSGKKGVIRIFDCHRTEVLHTFSGHGSCINDLSVHRTRPNLFISASKDHSLRLWNMRTKVCVFIFYGDGGHSNEVISVDWHQLDPFRLISSGLDSTVKIWDMTQFKDYMDKSDTWEDSDRVFPTYSIRHPLFDSVQIHTGYVDCIRSLTDLVVSKSVDDKVLVWRPDLQHDPKGIRTCHRFTILQELHLRHANMWYLRFSMDGDSTLLAAGNSKGTVSIWRTLDTSNKPIATLSYKPCLAAVRQTALSRSGNIVLACYSNSSISRWDRKGDGNLLQGTAISDDSEGVQRT